MAEHVDLGKGGIGGRCIVGHGIQSVRTVGQRLDHGVRSRPVTAVGEGDGQRGVAVCRDRIGRRQRRRFLLPQTAEQMAAVYTCRPLLQGTPAPILHGVQAFRPEKHLVCDHHKTGLFRPGNRRRYRYG